MCHIRFSLCYGCWIIYTAVIMKKFSYFTWYGLYWIMMSLLFIWVSFNYSARPVYLVMIIQESDIWVDIIKFGSVSPIMSTLLLVSKHYYRSSKTIPLINLELMFVFTVVLNKKKKKRKKKDTFTLIEKIVFHYNTSKYECKHPGKRKRSIFPWRLKD